MRYAPKLIDQLVFNEKGADVGEIDVAKDASNDLSWLLFDNFWNNIGLNVHHVVGKVGLDVGLHNSSLGLFLHKHLHHLHYLIVRPLSSQVIPPLFMFCLARNLFGRGVVIILGGWYHHAVLLIVDWNVWNIFEWWRTFIEWVVHCTLKHGVRSLFITLKDQSGIV